MVLTAFAIFGQVVRHYAVTTCIKENRMPTIAQCNLYTFNFSTYFRKMLIADINELKYQQEDAKKPNAEEEGEGKEDVTFLKLALK